MADLQAVGRIRRVYRRTTTGSLNNRSTDLMFSVGTEVTGVIVPADGYFAIDLAGPNAADSLERLVYLAAEHGWPVRVSGTTRTGSKMVDVYDLIVDT